MNITNLKTLLRTMIEHNTPVTPYVWGAHGLGKSAAVAQVAQEVGYRMLDIRLSQKEAIDLTGMLYTFEDKKLGMSVTGSHPPEWFADALANGKIVLFVDEFNQGTRETQKAAFELVLDRRLNNRKLPDNVFIVAAGNPEDDRYDVTPMSEALKDRFMHIHITPDTEAWVAWAESSRKINSDVLSFIKTCPRAACAEDARNDKFPIDLKHSYRSWERLGIIHQLPLPLPIKSECYRGIVGPEYATAFIRSLAGAAVPLTANEILAMSDATVKKIKEFATADNVRMDLLSSSVDNLVAFCKTNTKTAMDKFDNVKEFINLLPDDLSAKLITGVHELPGWSEKLLKDSKIKAKLKRINEASTIK